MPLVQHLPQQVHGLPDSSSIDQPFGQVPVGNRRRAKGSIGQNVSVNIESLINSSIVTVRVDNLIVGDNIRNYIGLIEEEVKKSDSVVVALGTVHGSNYCVAGEDGGTSAREYRVPGKAGSGVKIGGSDKRLDSIVEVEPRAYESGGGVRQARSVGIPRRRRRRGITAESMKWRFDAEAPFPAATLGGSLFGGREGHGAVWK